MNKERLKESLWYRVRLRPIARRFNELRELKSIDDDWIVVDVGTYANCVELNNVRTGHILKVAFDQIHHFSEDVARDWNGLKHGFFELRGQARMNAATVVLEPLPSYCPNCGAATSRGKPRLRKSRSK